jgi:hypothetical protein
LLLARPTIEGAFRSVIDIAPNELKALTTQRINIAFDGLNRTLRDDAQALAGHAYQSCFGQNLIVYEKDAGMQVAASRKTLRDGLNTVYGKAWKFTNKGYFHTLMDLVYAQTLLEKPGKAKKLKNVCYEYLEENIVGPEGPPLEIAELAVEDVKQLIDVTCNKLREEVVTIIKSIRAAFQR